MKFRILWRGSDDYGRFQDVEASSEKEAIWDLAKTECAGTFIDSWPWRGQDES